MKNRIFRVLRVLVCLVVICALLVNVSPIRAKAVLVESQLLYWGVVGLVTLMTCGVFFEFQNQYQIEALGRTYYDHVSSSGTSAEQLELINAFVTASAGGKIIPFRNPNSSDSGSDWLKLLGAATLSFVARFLQVNPDFIEVPRVDVQSNIPYVSSGSMISAGTFVPSGIYGYYVVPNHDVLFLGEYTFISGATQSQFNVSRYFLDPLCSSFVVRTHNASGKILNSISADKTIELGGQKYTYCVLSSSIPCSNSEISTVLPYMAGLHLNDGTKTVFDAYLDGSLNPDSVTEEIAPGAIHGTLQDSIAGMTGNETLDIPDIDFSSMSSEQDIIDTANKIISGEMTYEELLNQFTGGAAPELVPLPEVNPDTGDGFDPTTSTEPDSTSPVDPGETPDTGGVPGEAPDPGTGTNPDPGTGTDPDTGTDTDPDTDSDPNPNPNPDTDTDSNPIKDFANVAPGDFVFDIPWMDFFPFCIPKDIYDLVMVFDAEPEAPRFVFDIDFPYMDEPWHIDIDFSAWDTVALVMRRLELLLFVVGLAKATRNYYIRG